MLHSSLSEKRASAGRKNIICLGNIAFDLLEKKVLTGKISVEAKAGGSVLNTAVMLRNLGSAVKIVSRSGNDFLGEHLISRLLRFGIDISNVIRDPETKTPIALARINKKGDSSYTFYPGGSKPFPVKVPEGLFKGSFLLHTGSMFSYADESFPATISHVRAAGKKGLIVTYDPNWRPNRVKDPDTARDRIRCILKYTDILKLKDTELNEITGKNNERAALSSLMRTFRGRLFVTLGDKGAYYWDGNKKLHVPAFKVKVADTIGAGDAFTAGLIYHIGLSGGKMNDPLETLLFASAVSALCCTRHGGTDGVRDLSQVNRFLGERS
jgi:fructokinase